MNTVSISALTICGLDELPAHIPRGVTHVLSLLDPGHPEPEVLRDRDLRARETLRFHDGIEVEEGRSLPEVQDVAAIIDFGDMLAASQAHRLDGHLLVHCHMGVSRSTAAMLILMAQANPLEAEDNLFERLRLIRPQAWPNSRMIAFADEMLCREGRLTAALGRHFGHQIRMRPELAGWIGELGRGRELEMAA